MPRVNRLMILNGIIYLIGGTTYFYGFQTVPLSEAMVIFQTNPAISGILAVFFLREAYDLIQFFITILCMGGVMLIAKPSFLFGTYADNLYEGTDRAGGIISLLIGASAIGCNSIVIKKIVTHVDPNLSAFFIGLIPSILGGAVMLTEDAKMLTYYEAIVVARIAILGYFAQVFYNRAFKFGDAGKISMMAYSQIIFAFILEIFVLERAVDFYSTIGGVCIFCCMFLRMYQTWKNDKMKEALEAKL